MTSQPAGAAPPKAADWSDLPRGFYALHIFDYDADLLGYSLFERKVPRETKTGRRMGRNLFIYGATMIASPELEDRLVEHIAVEKRVYGGEVGYGKAQVEELLADPDGYRAVFGQLTGKCGCCGRKLTDPTSKLLGIGPDCRGEL